MASSVREPHGTTAPLDKVLSRLFGSRENPPPDKFYITIQNKFIDFVTFSEKVLKKSLNHLNAKEDYDVMSGGEGFTTFARGSVPVHIESFEESFCAVVGVILEGGADLMKFSGPRNCVIMKSLLQYDFTNDANSRCVIGAALTDCGKGVNQLNAYSEALNIEVLKLNTGDSFVIEPG